MWCVRRLRQMDWVTRHWAFYQVIRPYQIDIAWFVECSMGPDELLEGADDGHWPWFDHVAIPLPDAPRDGDTENP